MILPRIFFLALLASHLLADFPLQSDALNQRKRKSKLAVAWHAALHALLTYAILGIWNCWQVPIAIFLAHGLIDFLRPVLLRIVKLFGRWPTNSGHELYLFGLDQLLHIAVLVVLTLCFRTYPWPGTFWPTLCGATTYVTTLWFVCGLVSSVWVGSVVVGIMIYPYHRQSVSENSLETGRPGLANAGRTIGRLERFLIFVLALAGQYTTIGFLITAKSILRYREVTDSGDSQSADTRKEPEYVLIGTLLSIAWVVAIAAMTVQVRPYFVAGGLTHQPAPPVIRMAGQAARRASQTLIKH